MILIISSPVKGATSFASTIRGIFKALAGFVVIQPRSRQKSNSCVNSSTSFLQALKNAPTPVIHVVSTQSGVSEKICDDCGLPMGWSPNGRSIYYYYWGSAARYGSIDLATRQQTELIHHQKYNLHMLRFFPDGNWLTFHMPILLMDGRSSILIAPVRDGVATGENEWIPITDGAGIEATPWPSPDGAILYFLSKRDGFQCIWAQHLDSVNKRPKGLPFVVAHFHGARYKVREAGFGPGTAAAKLIFTMSDSTGNIWITNIEARDDALH